MENENETSPSFFRFEDLRIYHKSMDYIKWVYNNTMTFPEGSPLIKPFALAAHSIAINIAEGSARNKSQFIYYLKTAKTALRECIVYTAIAYQDDLISQDAYDESRNYLMELTRMIGALIASLQKSQREKEHEQDHEHDNNHETREE